MNRLSLILLSLTLVVACGGGAKPKVKPQQGLIRGTPEFTVNEGIVLLNEGKYDEAEQKLARAVKEAPALTKGHSALGIVYTAKRNFPQAIEQFQIVLRQAPQFYDAYNYLGMVYSEMGDYNRAKENLLIAASSAEYLTPENSYANLGLLEIKFKKYESALRYADKGLAFSKRFPPLHYVRGLALKQLGKLPEAIDSLEQAWALQPVIATDINVAIDLARLYYQLGDKNKALDMLESSLGKTTAPPTRARVLQLIREIDGMAEQESQTTPKEGS